jgi:hypothetical protein
VNRDAVALWGSITVSILVVLAFAYVTGSLFNTVIPAESKELALILFGALASNFGAVIQYWVGSSVGSSRKDATISKLTETP